MAVERSADLVLVQEPPVCQSFTQYGYNILWTSGRVCTAVRRGQPWSASLIDRLAGDSRGDVQVLDIKHSSGTLIARVVNVYAAPVFGSGSNDRPCEEANWTEILEDGTGVIGGDLNCHSSRWDDKEEKDEGRNAAWTIGVTPRWLATGVHLPQVPYQLACTKAYPSGVT